MRQGRRPGLLAVSLSEREEISRGLAEGQSMRGIASSIQRAPSTVSREIGRDGGRATYGAAEAERGAWGTTPVARNPVDWRLSDGCRSLWPGSRPSMGRRSRLRAGSSVAEASREVEQERGVHNPRVVDLMRLDAEADEVELLMLETRPWGSDPRQLEAKFNR
jgi:hypothetical protein